MMETLKSPLSNNIQASSLFKGTNSPVAFAAVHLLQSFYNLATVIALIVLQILHPKVIDYNDFASNRSKHSKVIVAGDLSYDYNRQGYIICDCDSTFDLASCP